MYRSVRAKTEETLGFLMTRMARVLTEDGHPEVAARLPWRDGMEPVRSFPAEVAERGVQAYSIALQLLAQSEENATAQDRRAPRRRPAASPTIPAPGTSISRG
jgi:hypothetical protein